MLPLAAVHHGYGKAKAYFEREFPAEMAERMATIPQQRLVEPQPFVAAKAVEGLAYSHEESELREMYLSLLATAMDSSTAAKAHPAFAKIIHSASSSSARCRRTALPTAPHRLKTQRQDSRYSTRSSRYSSTTDPITASRQERQIVQSWFNLRDSLRAPWKGALSLRVQIPPGNCRSSRLAARAVCGGNDMS